MVGNTWESYRRSWRLSLRAGNKSVRTIETYTLAVDQLGAYLDKHKYPTDPSEVERAHIEEFIGYQLDTNSSATAKQRYQSLRSFFSWIEEEEAITNPMAKIRPPKVEEKPPPVLTNAEMSKLLASVSGRSFADRRDSAIMHLLADSGIRAGELTSLKLADIDLDNDVVHVKGKGGKYRSAPFGYQTAQAIDRYLRVRKHNSTSAHTDFVFVGKRGPITRSGLGQMVKRRGNAAGIDGLHPHMFRHTFVHRWLADGGQEGDVARILGWSRKSAGSMLERYGASAATERAHDAHKRFGPVDRL